MSFGKYRSSIEQEIFNMERMRQQQRQQSQGLASSELGIPMLRFNRSTPKKESKMKELLTDAKKFIIDNRAIIYTVALIVVLDHFLLDGKLRGKIEALLSSGLDKIKGKLDAE